MSEHTLPIDTPDDVRFVLVVSGKGAGWSAEKRVRMGGEWVLTWATAFLPTESDARRAITNAFGV